MIELFLSAYENDAWNGCATCWLEDKYDRAPEILATKSDGTTLVLEHTLIQPFVDEKDDSNRFSVFRRIENNVALVVPERKLKVFIPVGALPVGYPWDEIGAGVLSWLTANHADLPGGRSERTVLVENSSRNGPLALHLGTEITWLPGLPGYCELWRSHVPQDLGKNVEKALGTKLAKLVGTSADKRILLFEYDQIQSSYRIYDEVAKRQVAFPGLVKIDEIWFADTVGYESHNCVAFELIDSRGLVESLAFQNGGLKLRREERTG